MDKLKAIRVFVRVVETQSFARAAESLGMAPASVTMSVQKLESELSLHLLNRSTRSLSLTDDGAAYFEVCRRVLTELDETEATFNDVTRRPHGRLRIDMAPAIAYRIVIPRLNEFHRRYPDIKLVMGVGDRQTDLVQEGIDCAIRVGELHDSSLIARRLGYFDFVICGAAHYFENHPFPETAEDLQNHKVVKYFSTMTGRPKEWSLNVNGVITEIKSQEVIAVNDADAFLACALRGLGLVMISRFLAMPYLEKGELVEVMQPFTPKPLPVSVVYPGNRHLSPKVRAYADWVKEVFSSSPLVSPV